MACGLEVRAPFLDAELVDFIQVFPPSFKFGRNQTKRLLKRAAASRLPASILARPKKGFGIPVAAWLRGPLAPLMAQLLGRERLERQGLFRPEEVARRIAEHQSGLRDHRKPLWTLLMFQLWCDHWLRGTDRSDKSRTKTAARSANVARCLSAASSRKLFFAPGAYHSDRCDMRILVVSDIHANWAALAAINQPFDVCLCLGDLVDYGPDPAPCVRWAMTHATYAIRGNHDHGVAQGIPVSGENGFRYLTQVSRPSMWDALGPEERRYLLQLPVTQRVHAGRQAIPPGPCHATRPARRVSAQGPADLGQAAAERRRRRRLRGPYPHSVQHSGQRRRGPQPGQRGTAARRRSARRLRHHRRQQDRDEARRLSRRGDHRPDRGDALAAPGQGDHWRSCSAPAVCPRTWITTASAYAVLDDEPGSGRRLTDR